MGESERLIKELFGTATYCAFPGCLEKLIVLNRGMTVVNVDMAHIRSPKPLGPRYDKNYPRDLIHKAPNRLLLCKKHHPLVDTAASVYSIEELESWKRNQIADGYGSALPDELAAEIVRYYEGFSGEIATDPEFGRWRADPQQDNTSPSHGIAAGFAHVADDPVSVSAVRSVAQLIDGFAEGAVLPPQSASAFGATVAAFLLDDDFGFTARLGRLERCYRDDPFEAMLASIVFSVTAVHLWEATTKERASLLRDSWVATGLTIPYVADIVLAARYGKDNHNPLPGHPDDQWKVTINLGKVTAMTVELIAGHQGNPLVSVVQDLLIGVQRVPVKCSIEDTT
ncbi:hypothetical protein [Amycolatopsis sp. NPDC059021]|uniref:hypothetical protein n=1 Tax=Amycolatopsis sp. NPDC059021 TaxID=3346704 RepID=UPI00366CAFF7